jgi:hypothetical protein
MAGGAGPAWEQVNYPPYPGQTLLKFFSDGFDSVVYEARLLAENQGKETVLDTEERGGIGSS